jgi:hypothetical protein
MSASHQHPNTLEPAGQWVQQAACLGHADAMHPDNDEQQIENAKRICAGCTVTFACFWDAVRTGDNQHGIRAGLRANERRAVIKELRRREREKQAAVEPEPEPKRTGTTKVLV